MNNNKLMENVPKKKFSFLNLIVILFYFGLFFSSSIKPVEYFYEENVRTYSNFTSLFSNNSQLIVMISSIGLILTVMLQLYRKKRIPKLNLPLVLFIILKAWLILILFAYDILDFNSVLSIFLVIVLAQSVLLFKGSREAIFFKLGISIGIFASIFVIMNYYEILVNPPGVFWKGRLFGTTNHPNFLGGYMAMMFPFLGLLIMSVHGYKRLLVGLIMFLSIGLVLLTGSRSSVLALSLGILFWNYMYKGWLKNLYAIAIIIFFVSIISIFGIIDFFTEYDASRLGSTTNTRTEVIALLLDVFYNNFLFGNPTLAGQTSNSYLSFLARGGIVAGMILFLLLIVIFYHIRIQPKGKLLSSTYISSLISLLVYAFFEGVLVESFSLGQIIFIFILTYLGRKVQ